MTIKTLKILDIPITTESKSYILEEVEKYLEKVKSQKSKVKSEEVKPLVILTPNPEIIMQSGRDKMLNKILREGDYNLVDGAGIVWAAKFLHNRHIKRVSGVEMMEELVKLAAKKGYSVLLIGGRPGVAVEALECLRRKYGGVAGSVIEAIFISVEEEKLVFTDKNGKVLETIGQIDKIVSEIKKNDVKIVFVGLGCPKQEYLIQNLEFRIQNSEFKRSIVLMAVGGSFDYISGRVPRAPEFMRKASTEWLYRLIREPWRLPRIIRGAEFFWKVLFRR